MYEITILIGISLFFIVLFASFVQQLQNVRLGRVSRRRGALLLVTTSALPVLAYVGLFFGLVAIEEFTHASVVSDSYARALVPVTGAATILTVLGVFIFSIVVICIPSSSEK